MAATRTFGCELKAVNGELFMPDIYAKINELDPAVVAQVANVLELRATDAQQRQMREHYLARISFPFQARVLEVGCGTGAVTRALAARPGVAQVVGLDPSPALLAQAQKLSAGDASVLFEPGDARALPFAPGTFDVAVFHTALCHIPEPQRALAEVFRVLKAGGALAIFDANYADTTLATDPADPLQTCALAAVNIIAFDPALIARLPGLVKAAGFAVHDIHTYIYDGSAPPDYMLTIVDRGADALLDSGRVGSELSAALKSEARRRVQAGKFFGQISYASLIARKPDGKRRP
jgi:SAM-dependent methyltransferase